MIVMTFMLTGYWAQSRHPTPVSGGLPCPPELEALLATNSREVVQSVTDGNCALHAFAISIVDEAPRNVNLSTMNAYKKLLSAWRAGVNEANAYLRQRCVDWMKKMKDSIAWEGMSFGVLAVAMSSHQGTSFAEHVARLARDGEWLDASALHALACSFKADLMVWQSTAEPALLGHSCAADVSPSTIMLHVALVNDLHFWGVRMQLEQQRFKDLRDEADFMMRSTNVNQRVGPMVDSDDDLAPPNEHPRVRSDDSVELELGLCKALATWDPWAPPTTNVVDALSAFKTASSSSADATGRACLVRQNVIHQLQYEADHFKTIPTRFKYHAVARWKLQCDHVVTRKSRERWNFESEYIKNVSSLSMEKIAARLSKPCWINKTVHCCLDEFRENPNIVLTWQLLWRSLPAWRRRETLLALYRQRGTNADADADSLLMPFLGKNVCRRAFLALTGLGSNSLTRARSAAAADKRSSLSGAELGSCLLIKNTNRPKLYLDARMWLEHFADSSGEHSPMHIETFLPNGRKSDYYAMYVYNRRDRPSDEVASIATFLEAWRVDLPYIRVASSLSKFIRCGVCDYLRDQIDRCPRENTEYLRALVRRLMLMQLRMLMMMLMLMLHVACWMLM